MTAADMYRLAERIFPICRSLTGEGVRETLRILGGVYPLTIHSVPSGTPAFDWTVPREWNIRDAYVAELDGTKVIDFQQTNLHVVGYSTPVDTVMDREALLSHLYSDPNQPDVIPYVTSYYKERFGFCVTDRQKQALDKDVYRVFIDSDLRDGVLNYGEIYIPGETEEEVLFSTYVCHPSMANNEISGPVVAIHLAKAIAAMPSRRHGYRFLFVPETIGAITYISQHLEALKRHVVAGYVVSCVGDNRAYSYVASRYGDTLADKTLQNVLRYQAPDYKAYTFLQRGSDERQYCAPGVDLPVCTFCRSKFGSYPEYHTSLDDLSLISPEGLQGAYDVLYQCVRALEYNRKWRVRYLCEPQLGKRGLYPTVSQKGTYGDVRTMTNLIAYADGCNDLVDISNIIGMPVEALIPFVEKLYECDIIG